jgi:hypothetical protein
VATQADHIDFEPRTSSFLQMIIDDCKYHDDAYHRKIAYAARIKRAIANPRGRRLNVRVDKMWTARQVSKAIINSAAAEIAAAKAMRRAEEIFNGMLVSRSSDSGGGMNLDG